MREFLYNYITAFTNFCIEILAYTYTLYFAFVATLPAAHWLPFLSAFNEKFFN